MHSISAQAEVESGVKGMVSDENGVALPGATVYDLRQPNQAVVTNQRGAFELNLAPGNHQIRIGFVGFDPKTIEVSVNAGQWTALNVRLKAGVALGTSEVIADGSRSGPIQNIDPKVATRIPSPRGTIEDLLIQAPVNFNSELSSSYNVRGGSFDENLVYVNEIEVYRPFLVRAGQQEGLSFPNPDMVESIEFSAGGFEAKYGDKLSSVLDIRYRKPTTNRMRVSGSLLGGQVQRDWVSNHGPNGHRRWTLNSGIRFRDNSYVLGSLDEGGEYQPRYVDFQNFITWDPDGYGPWEVEALAIYGQNRYQFIPVRRESNVGNINEALKLTIYFDGKEKTAYSTGFGALSINHVTENHRIRWINSAFQTAESETFDILGAYWLDELERDLGSDELGEAAVNRGVGAYLDHARNRLYATVLSSALKGSSSWGEKNQFLEWGLKWQYEDIEDHLSEWSLVDSAGFITPHPRDSIGYIDEGPDQIIMLDDVIRASNDIQSQRIQAFAQNTWNWSDSRGGQWEMNLGFRSHLWTFNNQLVGGPRGRISFEPETAFDQPSTVWNFAAGVYWQPPFYREMRRFDGTINESIEAQKATHFVLGMDRIFEMYNRPFKMVGELYYKDLDMLIPYEIENVRQRYYARNNSAGYATGADFMLNGEFIEGIQSWFRMSVLKTEEDLNDDEYWQFYNSDGQPIIAGYTLNNEAVDSTLIVPGLIPRQTDQRFNMSLLFQDEMPGNDAYKVLVSLYFGTGLPFGPPSYERYQDILRTPTYRRVDIGFSRELFDKSSSDLQNRSGFISLEIFNILGIRNTINHTWIEDVNGRLYAIPNYLTNRRVNLKVGLEF
ncbi:MAG: carboxypeptidase regulatory-like domain-containing protein [Bacteroidetes bacterium]|nr:carboxypeptidase regulatory-like domain-containing protein [Bacteroidota bacterium]MDA1336401.1 carboxypeptidase regulatory-like domain-containing protein [Bacteroidota bacterium]